ncbi:sensor histidine kinase [Pinibacter aurantiacus]|uniref:histidine kinase n=1 Tax=Pinibacter aurantiacus TaxID=2851599 RepID=A0A9E2SBR8_9BACT|nr:HAMP domain-containing sensor histidine kinase [Pinibacter aurantiacus]MBV4358199.1 HAMP domain-containing histidine kinase [Pinibacter aurantiacus]
MAITILPPPWKTWWAYSLYILFVLALAFGIIFFFVSRTALRRKIRYEHMVNIKQQELHQMKMDFFTHISHEIRTPLTMIIGPVDVLINTLPTSPGPQKMLNSIKSSAERLLKLTNDLLDFRKADSGYTQLKKKSTNIVAFTHYVYDKFSAMATNKNIHFKFESLEKDIQVNIDDHYMEIVLSNLLSNAIKFTPVKGNISISIFRGKSETVEIHVCDDGVGIPKEMQSKIFSNFYQADAGSVKNVGSGIGLAFSKRLVELHKGSLSFTSEMNQATGNQETRFIITLTLGNFQLNNVR